ncbi:MAG: hypothetical protein ACYC3I_20640 [Gemmataceae bacterium]
MKRWQRKGMMGLFVGCSLVLAGTASAGPYVNLMQPCDCPPNHYSAMHVLTPIAWRWAAWCQGPCKYTFARVLNPDIPTTYNVKKYCCPSVNPLQFSVQNYVGLGGNVPSSQHQTPPQAQLDSGKTPQQDLPPNGEERPRPEKLPAPREEKDKPN